MGNDGKVATAGHLPLLLLQELGIVSAFLLAGARVAPLGSLLRLRLLLPLPLLRLRGRSLLRHRPHVRPPRAEPAPASQAQCLLTRDAQEFQQRASQRSGTTIHPSQSPPPLYFFTAHRRVYPRHSTWRGSLPSTPVQSSARPVVPEVRIGWRGQPACCRECTWPPYFRVRSRAAAGCGRSGLRRWCAGLTTEVVRRPARRRRVDRRSKIAR